MQRLIFCALLFPIFLCAHSFKEKMAYAHPGDFVVTEEGANVSLLIIRHASKESLTLEELTAPKNARADFPSWKEWVAAKAPGHTSWIVYEVDLSRDTLKESFSFSSKGWLYLDESEYLLAKLLTLPFASLPSAQRKRIGPPPSSGERDLRSLWVPSVVFEGKKKEKPLTDVWQAKWPKDGSKLASCDVVLYFDALQPDFPFPFWTEIQSPHYAFKIRAIDAGSGMVSPQMEMPERPPQFTAPMQQTADALVFTIEAPAYYNKLQLFALDVTEGGAMIPLPSDMRRIKNNTVVAVRAEKKELSALLTAQHRYRFIVIPEGTKHAYAETEDTVLWELQSAERNTQN